MTVLSKQYVVRLDVAMNDSGSVQRVDGNDKLSDVKTCPSFGKPLAANEHGHHIAARNVFHNKVQVTLILKAVMHPDDERVLADGGQDEALKPNMIDLPLAYHIGLSELLHGIKVGGYSVTHEEDLSKTALANLADDGVIGDAHGFALSADVLKLAHELLLAKTEAGGFVDATTLGFTVDSGHGSLAVVIEAEEVAIIDLYLALCESLLVGNVGIGGLSAMMHGVEGDVAGAGGRSWVGVRVGVRIGVIVIFLRQGGPHVEGGCMRWGKEEGGKGFGGE